MKFNTFIIVALAALQVSAGEPLLNKTPVCSGNTCGGYIMTDEQLTQDLQLLEKLVNMPSETTDIAGVTAVVEVIRDEFLKLGFKTNLMQNPNLDATTQKPISADLLVAELKGKKDKFITFIVHADTVFKTTAEGKVPVPFKIVDSVQMPLQIGIPGKRIIGSGVGDNKGGVVLLLRTLKMILAKGTPDYSLRAIISTNEEVGSPGHKIAMANYGVDSVAVLGLEPSGMGNILNGRGGVHWYEVTVTGTEAHAGMAHEKGVNACLDLSIKIAKAAALTDYSKETTVNIGTITGGKRANVVCGEAKGIFDTRFPTLVADKNLEAKLNEIFTKPEVTSNDGTATKSQTTVKTTAFSGTFESPAVSAPYFQHVLMQIKNIDGYDAIAKYSRGGADISNVTSPNAIMIDGLGPAVDGSHTSFEYIVLETMRSRALVLADLISKIP